VNRLAEFFSPEAGQRRRQWLEGVDASIANRLRYALGPHAYPVVEGVARGANMLSDGADFRDAYTASGDLMGARSGMDALQAGATMGAATLGAILPGVSARAVTDATETAAQQVARMLREGRAAEVTDDLMARVDPQEMYRLYEGGATGMPMPMDVRSRMQRAEDGGFDMMHDFYHGTAREGFNDATDIVAFDPARVGDRWGADKRGFSITSSPQDANFYARRQERGFGSDDLGDGAVYPLMHRPGTPHNVRVGPMDGTISAWDARPENTYARMEAAGADYARLFDRDNGIEMRVVMDPTSLRSRFARFDPRLSHLANLSAGVAGVGVAGALATEREDGWEQAREYLRGLGLLD